jgi:hypothetical protein
MLPEAHSSELRILTESFTEKEILTKPALCNYYNQLAEEKLACRASGSQVASEPEIPVELEEFASKTRADNMFQDAFCKAMPEEC